jgi:hypothetical protein
MRLSSFMQQVQSDISRSFADFPTCELYVGQFNPELDQGLSHKAPALFTGLVNMASELENRAIYDVVLNIASVIVVSELDRHERELKGLDYIEKFLLTLDTLSCLGNQANVPRVESVVKTDRVSVDANNRYTNAGYSYWTILWSLPYRLNTVMPGEYFDK